MGGSVGVYALLVRRASQYADRGFDHPGNYDRARGGANRASTGRIGWRYATESRPLKVAETYKMLAALHPGRIDLGIGRAPGTDTATALALRGSRQALIADDFPEKLSELEAFGKDGMGVRHSMATVAAMPPDAPLPDFWLLGSSDYSAQLAAAIGVGYAFAAHFSDFPPQYPLRAVPGSVQARDTGKTTRYPDPFGSVRRHGCGSRATGIKPVRRVHPSAYRSEIDPAPARRSAGVPIHPAGTRRCRIDPPATNHRLPGNR